VSRTREREQADGCALEILCRVFHDGADEAFQEWQAFDRSGWFHWSRALGAFIATRLARDPAYQRGVREGLQQAIRLIHAAQQPIPPEARCGAD